MLTANVQCRSSGPGRRLSYPNVRREQRTLMLVAACLLATLSPAALASKSGQPSLHPLSGASITAHTTLRHLQASAETEEAAVVTTPLELLSAITAGAAHLELRGHLDLTNLLASGGTRRASEAAVEDGVGADGAEGPMDAAAMQSGGVYSSLAYLLGTLSPSVKTIRVRVGPARPWCWATASSVVPGRARPAKVPCAVCCAVWRKCGGWP